jgi:hypothetical protein
MDSAYCHESVTCVLNHSLQTVYAKPMETKRMVDPRRPSRSHCLDRKMRCDPESEEKDQGVAPGTMQARAEEITEFPIVIRIERRLKKLPGRVQAEGKDRDGKLGEPAQQSGNHHKSVRRRPSR